MFPFAVARPGILVVEDDDSTRGLLQIALRDTGFGVWLAADGVEGLDLYGDHGDEIDVVLLDVQLPRLDGPQTLHGLQRIRPAIQCCFMTGDPGLYRVQDLLRQGARRVFAKPLDLWELIGVLRQLACGDAAITRAVSH
jgi:DNA-binding NtrC family response regulator